MDWLQTFTILVAIGGGFLYLLKEIQKLRGDLTQEIQKVREDLTKEIQKVREDLTKEIQKVREDLTKEINEVKMEVLWIKFQLGYNPDKQQEIHKEEPKEN